MARTRNRGAMTACTQPGCTGTLVDGYCDICGSPAGAAAFVPAGSAASTASPAPVPVYEERPTQRIPRVKMPRQQLAKQGRADPGTAVPGAVAAQQVDTERVGPAADDTAEIDGEKELIEREPGSAQDYRKRVEDAQLPDNVREVALREVHKLERTSDQSPEAGDIRSWLDTILDLPWSTKATDWIDIQGSGEVEATLQRLIKPADAEPDEDDTAKVKPAVADLEGGDTAKVEPAAAEVEKTDTAKVHPTPADTEEAERAPAGPRDDDAVETAAVVAIPSASRHPGPQPTDQQVVGPALVETPAKKRRFGSLALAVTALVALIIGAVFFAASRQDSATGQSPPTVTGTATETASRPTIQLEDVADSGRPFQPVRIQGTYHGGPDTFLRLQREEGGNWVDFPLPTKTDQSGHFTAYVELGPGRYRLRVLDPASGVTSEPFVLVIEG